MRLVPPKTKKNYFNEQEYYKYILNHSLINADGEKIKLDIFFIFEVGENGLAKTLLNILPLFPLMMQTQACFALLHFYENTIGDSCSVK